MSDKYDVIVIGGGPGGYAAALYAALRCTAVHGAARRACWAGAWARCTSCWLPPTRQMPMAG